MSQVIINKEGEDWSSAVATSYFYNYEDKCLRPNCIAVHNTEENYIAKDCEICKKEYCEYCAEEEFYSDFNHECKICLPYEDEDEEEISGEVILLKPTREDN